MKIVINVVVVAVKSLRDANVMRIKINVVNTMKRKTRAANVVRAKADAANNIDKEKIIECYKGIVLNNTFCFSYNLTLIQ
ncbi:MAG: hypothetical protein KID00_06615 [Clostridium argentinense]|uniref:Uncharacterized protein n=1 Tax=Clostridium faecium TaxID=2762223 RepID=A0ABR8YSF7_9CLOT|nr:MULTISPECIES: hypothetical protein [Clostridium]MBD8047067.1 hypothetical protein [Clostridium faecium]MBS5823521.1 hypothetical protein [Clostridium argentinense]